MNLAVTLLAVVVFKARGGWKSKSAHQKSKFNVIMRQEELIAQKKREIEAKLAEQAKQNLSTPSKPAPPPPPTPERLQTTTHSLLLFILIQTGHPVLGFSKQRLLCFQYPRFAGTGTDLKQVCERWKLSSAISKNAEGEIQPRFR